MTEEEDFHNAMLAIYDQAGKECGYWAKRFLQGVRRNGGLAYARKMLSIRRNDSRQGGFNVLMDAGRSDISVEALALRPQFSPLFSSRELNEARRRLNEVPEYAIRKVVPVESVFAESIRPDLRYTEGAVKAVTVNAYERDTKARAACLAKHGYGCEVCGINFGRVYGTIGQGFIHVHHKKPLATMRGEYELDPINDLVPVCPNCHAMLHTSDPPLSVEELKRQYHNATNLLSGGPGKPE